MTRFQGTARRGPRHGNRRPKLPLVLQQRPDMDAVLREGSAAALKDAAISLKGVQASGAGSSSTAERWWNDGEGSPVLAHSRMIYALAHRPGARAGMLVANANATLAQALMPLSDADLVQRFWDLCKQEARKEGQENECAALLAETGDLLALADADIAEAGIQAERAAVARELHRRGIDPRPGRQR